MWSWLKNIVLPAWLKTILSAIWEVLKSIFLQVGKDAVDKIKAKIIEVSTMSVPNDQKFQLVFDYAKSLLPLMKESALNLLIEALVNQLKTAKTIV